MQIDKLLYNIAIRQDKEQQSTYIRQLQNQSLQQIKKEIIQKVQVFDPEDQSVIEEIQLALQLNAKLLQNQYFSKFQFNDEAFIMNLGFYMGHERQSEKLVLALEFVQHQVFDLKQASYFQSQNLFKSLTQIFQFIEEKYFERVVFLMVEMISNNKQHLQKISNRYDFLECLIQIINKQQQDKIIIYLFEFLRNIYSDRKAKLFHEKDIEVLIEIILRIINDSQNQTLIEETLRLYSVLKQNIFITDQTNKKREIKEAISDKLGFLDPSNISESLKLIITQTIEDTQAPE